MKNPFPQELVKYLGIFIEQGRHHVFRIDRGNAYLYIRAGSQFTNAELWIGSVCKKITASSHLQIVRSAVYAYQSQELFKAA